MSIISEMKILQFIEKIQCFSDNVDPLTNAMIARPLTLKKLEKELILTVSIEFTESVNDDCINCIAKSLVPGDHKPILGIIFPQIIEH